MISVIIFCTVVVHAIHLMKPSGGGSGSGSGISGSEISV